MTNSVTTDNLNPEPENTNPPVAKKAPAKKAPAVKKAAAPKVTTQSENGKKYVWFEAGSSYSLPSGFRFTQQNKMALLDEEEANRLLELDNFRNCTDDEIAWFINNQE